MQDLNSIKVIFQSYLFASATQYLAQAAQVCDTRARDIYNLMIKARADIAKFSLAN